MDLTTIGSNHIYTVAAGSGAQTRGACDYNLFSISGTIFSTADGLNAAPGLASGTGDAFGISYNDEDNEDDEDTLFAAPVAFLSGSIYSTSEIPLSIPLSGSGLIAEFDILNAVDNKVRIFLGAPPSSTVPTPLSIVGGLAAFGWSRKIRSRIAIRSSI